MTRMLPALAVVAGAALALAGCTASPPHPAPTPTATPTSAAKIAQIIDLVPLADGVVATGAFTPSAGAAGGVSGSVEIVKSGTAYALRLVGYSAPSGSSIDITSEQAASSPGCYDFWRLGFGDPSTWTSPDVPNSTVGLHVDTLLDASGRHPDLVDPTFLSSVVVSAARAHGTCQLTTLGVARLSWVAPSLRPDLQASDSGIEAGATGAVDADTTLYTVAVNDRAAAIADRFGLTVEDLMYLNPISVTTVDNPVIFPGQVFNLSPTGRGHPSIHHD